MTEKTNPFYSLIIATYNSGVTIEKCLNSILIQGYTNFEILIQDGNSTDNTLELLQKFNDTRIKISTEADEGIYDAMNKALKRSAGKWLYFLGSDDSLFSPDILENIHAAIGASPASKFVYGDVYTSENYIQRYNTYSYTRLLEMNICHQAIFYHHSLFTTLQYNTRYTLFADWDFNLKVFRKYNYPLYTGDTIADYNLTGKSGQWYNNPEYKIHFSDKKKLIRRYRGVIFLCRYYSGMFLSRARRKLSVS